MQLNCGKTTKLAKSCRSFQRFLHRSSFKNAQETKRGDLDPRKRRVVITGSGMITPLGTSSETVFDKLMKGQSGITSLKSDKFDYGKIGVYYAGQISPEDIEECEKVCQGDERLKSVSMKYAEFAATKALEEVGKYTILLQKL